MLKRSELLVDTICATKWISDNSLELLSTFLVELTMIKNKLFKKTIEYFESKIDSTLKIPHNSTLKNFKLQLL